MIKTYIETRYIKPMAEHYFFVEDLSGEENTLSIIKHQSEAYSVTVEYSTDEQNWQTLGTTGQTALTLTVPANGRVYLRATTPSWGHFAYGYERYEYIDMAKAWGIGGNIASLLYGANFIGQTTLPNMSEPTFTGLFNSWGTRHWTLQTADNLIIPFTTLSPSCCYQMFYQHPLTKAPDLSNINTINNKTFGSMFTDCHSLNSVDIRSITDWNTANTQDWLTGVAPTGTIYINSALDGVIPENSNSGIPSGWTKVVVNQ